MVELKRVDGRDVHLKPQDSFGEFKKKKILDLQKSAGNHQKTSSDLPAIVLE